MKTTNTHTENEFPTLESLKRAQGMKTPEGFFDDLQASILSKTTEPKKEKTKSIYRLFAYAASIAVVIGLSTTLFFGKNGQQTTELFGDMTVGEYLDDFSEIDLELEETLLFDETAMD